MSESTLRRATRNEIELNSRWQMGGVWDIEVDRVKRWLTEHAAENVGKHGAAVETAIRDGANLSKEVNLTFGAQGIARDPRVLAAAANGELERDAPARAAVIATDLLKWLTFMSESGIFVWMVVMGFSSGIVIAVGLMLAGSGLLAGDGAGRILIQHERARSWSDVRGWIELVIGTGGVAVISYIRTIGEEEGAFAIVAITALLATLIATFHAAHMVLAEKYREQHQKMFSAQTWFATDEHVKAYQTGFWTDYYDSEVRRMWNEQRQAEERFTKIPVQKSGSEQPLSDAPQAPDIETARRGPHDEAN